MPARTIALDGVVNFAKLDHKDTIFRATREKNHDVEMGAYPGGVLLGNSADPAW